MTDSNAEILARFERAKQFLPGNLVGTVRSLAAGPKWLSSSRGWVQRQTAGGFDVIAIDAESGAIDLLTGSDALRAALQAAADTTSPLKPSSVTVTDVAIGCTALLESAGIEVFELGAWQSMSGIGRLTPQGGNS